MRGLRQGAALSWRTLGKPLLRRMQPPLDWRLLIWLVGLGLLLSPIRPAWLDALDRQLFQVGVSLLPAQPAPRPLDVLALTPAEMQQLLRDPLDSGQSTALVYALTASTRPVALLLPELPRTQPHSAERLLQDTPANEPIHQAWTAREQLRTRLLQWMASPQIFLASPTHSPYLGVDARIVDDAPASADNLPLWQRLAMRDIPDHPTLAAASGAGAFHLWPVATPVVDSSHEASPLTQQLLWRHGDGLYQGLVLALVRASTEDNAADSAYHWRAPHQLSLMPTKQNFRLNSDGSFLPAYQTATGTAPVVKEQDLKSFLQSGASTDLLIVGVAGDPALTKLVGGVQSLQSGHYFHSPWWTGVVEKGLLIGLLIYALWLMPKLASGVQLLITILLLLLLATSQIGYQLTQLRWLPLGVTMQFLLLATVLVLLWRRQQQPVEQLQRQHQEIALQWSRHSLQQGQLEQAFDALQHCSSTNDVLEQLYEIGGQHERKRRPAAAVAVYRHLQQRKRRYKDVNKRLQLLEQPQAFAHTTLMPSLSKTVVITDSHSQPQFGRYQVESELGRGAMGVVYLGFDPKISRKVAIKTLDYSRYDGDELVAVKARFFREAEAAGRLRHPNIVSVYDVGEDHDLAYIAMDYVEGQPLSDFTSKKAQLPIAEVCQIIADVADALHYAHGENIVHRDIKPSNILYHRDTGKVTVTDFGIARIVNEQSTQTGEILGSPLYMSPEQILGKKVDKASDIFSLGVTLFQLLTSELPFKGANIAELSRQILQGKPVDIRDLRPGLSASVRRIINKALQKDPGDRYRDAADMASALRKAD